MVAPPKGSGLYYRLRSSGVVDSRLVDDSDIEGAMHTPPRPTRARLPAGGLSAR